MEPKGKRVEPMGKTVEPSKQVVCDRARGCVLWSYHQNFLSSIAAAAACPLIRAVDPRRPAPHSGHRVAPRLDNRLGGPVRVLWGEEGGVDSTSRVQGGLVRARAPVSTRWVSNSPLL